MAAYGSVEEPVNEGDLLLVRRVYRLCDCGGWEESFEGYERNATGFSPNGMVLAGRRNHTRDCESHDSASGGA